MEIFCSDLLNELSNFPLKNFLPDLPRFPIIPYFVNFPKKPERRDMLTDPAFTDYPDLVAFVQKIVAQPDGNGTYTFTPTKGGPAVVKDAVWGTVGLHGTDWRIVVASER